MYYEVKVRVELDDGKRIKNIIESYLANAVSITDAETIINEHLKDSKLTFEVIGAKLTKIIKVLNDESN